MKRVLALAIGLAGCMVPTYIQPTPINPSPHPLTRRPADSVEVFASTRPERPFVDVAYLQATIANVNGFGTIVADFRAKAAAMGCDAIIFNGHDAKADYSATCIVYR
jgi:hypothetical protein